MYPMDKTLTTFCSVFTYFYHFLVESQYNVMTYGIYADFSLGAKVYQDVEDTLKDLEIGILGEVVHQSWRELSVHVILLNSEQCICPLRSSSVLCPGPTPEGVADSEHQHLRCDHDVPHVAATDVAEGEGGDHQCLLSCRLHPSDPPHCGVHSIYST